MFVFRCKILSFCITSVYAKARQPVRQHRMVLFSSMLPFSVRSKRKMNERGVAASFYLSFLFLIPLHTPSHRSPLKPFNNNLCSAIFYMHVVLLNQIRIFLYSLRWHGLLVSSVMLLRSTLGFIFISNKQKCCFVFFLFFCMNSNRLWHISNGITRTAKQCVRREGI